MKQLYILFLLITAIALSVQGEQTKVLQPFDSQQLSIDDEHDMRVFPNPANGYTKVEVTTSVQGFMRIELYSLLGEQVRNFGQFDIQQGQTQIPLDLMNIEPGVYFLQLQLGQQQETRRLVIR